MENGLKWQMMKMRITQCVAAMLFASDSDCAVVKIQNEWKIVRMTRHIMHAAICVTGNSFLMDFENVLE